MAPLNLPSSCNETKLIDHSEKIQKGLWQQIITGDT